MKGIPHGRYMKELREEAVVAETNGLCYMRARSTVGAGRKGCGEVECGAPPRASRRSPSNAGCRRRHGQATRLRVGQGCSASG
jgi:hypothetical protein